MDIRTKAQIEEELCRVNQRIGRLLKGDGRKPHGRNKTRWPILSHFRTRRKALEAELAGLELTDE